jgi:nitrate reductase gamma subunit
MKSFRIIAFVMLFLLPFQMFSQNGVDVEMADVLRTNGKIYVVVIGLVVILTGVIIFLLRVEKKLWRLENKENLNKK